ncbi:MAG TPA: hypothetical protein PLA94_26450 [Myxococcota bacterium]|nr:hypothetical protein [Myxococcota bacterium]
MYFVDFSSEQMVEQCRVEAPPAAGSMWAEPAREQSLFGRKSHSGLEVTPVPDSEPPPPGYSFRRWSGLPSIWVPRTALDQYAEGSKSLEKIFFRDVLRTLNMNDVEGLLMKVLDEISGHKWQSLRLVRVRAGMAYLLIEPG